MLLSVFGENTKELIAASIDGSFEDCSGFKFDLITIVEILGTMHSLTKPKKRLNLLSQYILMLRSRFEWPTALCFRWVLLQDSIFDFG